VDISTVGAVESPVLLEELLFFPLDSAQLRFIIKNTKKKVRINNLTNEN
jgi:hypothetical protein